MRAVLLITDLARGGAEGQLVLLATNLKARGWAVWVVSMLPPQAYVEALQRVGIPVYCLGMRRGVPDPRAVLRLVSILRHHRPHVLSSFMFHANLLARIAGKLAGVPVIVSSIRNENFGGLLRDKLLSITDWMGDMTTINSSSAARAIVQRGVVPRNRLRVIPNALQVERFRFDPVARARVRGALGLNEETFLWVAVGRLEPQKDYPTLLHAFAEVAKARREAMLRIAGQGPWRAELERLAERLNLGDRAGFLGQRTDIPEVLSAADGFVLSSAWEGLPNVVMEALAAERPVVATLVGGVAELVEEGESGFLVPPKNPEALAEAMLRLMALSRDERVRMGRAGLTHVKANYDLERVVDQWEALYRQLLTQKGIPL